MISAATVVQFIGLLVTSQLSGTGADVVMGKLTVEPAHVRIIGYDSRKLLGETNWPKAGSFSIGTIDYDYVLVDVENVTFEGPKVAFSNNIGDMPHLKCCCDTILLFKPDYADPNKSPAQRKAAHFLLDRGSYSTPPVLPNHPVITRLELDDNPVTIKGAGAEARELRLAANASVIVAQTTLTLLTTGHIDPHSDDFLAYYQMFDSPVPCTRQPSDGSPCNPRKTSCTTQGAKGKKPSRSKQPPRHFALGDINCSSSQWP